MEALAGEHRSYLTFWWKPGGFNFSFGILSHCSPPTAPFSLCCRGCRGRAGHRARKREGARMQSAWAGPATQGWWLFLCSFTVSPCYCSASRQRRPNSSGEPSKAWKPWPAPLCVRAISVLLPPLPKASGRAALVMSENLWLLIFYLRPTGFFCRAGRLWSM